MKKTLMFVFALVLSQHALAQPTDGERRPLPPNMPPAPNLERAAERLQLEDAQVSAIQEILKTHATQMRAQFEQTGERPTREQMEANRESVRDELSSILDQEQLEKVERFLANQRQSEPRPGGNMPRPDNRPDRI